MRDLIYSIMVTLDGYIAGPNGELDWAIIDEELHAFVNNEQRAIGVELYGRRTYEVMADFWPTAHLDPAAPAFVVEFARIWQDMPKIVFSRTLTRVGENTRLVRDNMVEEVQALKAQPGKSLSIGGSGVASTFIRLGLIDEYGLYIHPVILGGGKALFPSLDASAPLRLVESRTFGSGVVFLRYRRTG
jgi:dihydrofolate reductase